MKPAVGVGGVALHLGRLGAGPAAAARGAGARRGVQAEAERVVDEDDRVGVVCLLDLPFSVEILSCLGQKQTGLRFCHRFVTIERTLSRGLE